MTVSTLYTIPQWFVFAALFVVIYGWVEKKQTFRIIGLMLFIALSIFAVIILSGDYLDAGRFMTAEELASEQIKDDSLIDIPIQLKLIPAYWSFIIASIPALTAVFLEWKNKKSKNIFIVLTGLISLLGFFIINGAIRSL